MLWAGLDFVFPFVKGLRSGSAAEMIAAAQCTALRPGLCITHIGGTPIAGISLDASTQVMQNAGRPLTLTFRAVPSPWATDRPVQAQDTLHPGSGVSSMSGVSTPRDSITSSASVEDSAPGGPEPEPEAGTGLLDESVAVGEVDML